MNIHLLSADGTFLLLVKEFTLSLLHSDWKARDWKRASCKNRVTWQLKWKKVHKKYFAPDWIARTFTKSPIQKTSNFFWKKVSMSFSSFPYYINVKLWKLVQTQQTRKEACVCGWNPVLLKGKYFVCWNIFLIN